MLKKIGLLMFTMLLLFPLLSCGSSGQDEVYEDRDFDGIWDVNDKFPNDTDNDGLMNDTDPDDDNDGHPDSEDVFPYDPREYLDTDRDGIGNNADADDDGDGILDKDDVFPLDHDEWGDADDDGTGDNADLDDDSDGVPDSYDFYPTDPTKAGDLDGDGVDSLDDLDDDNDGFFDSVERDEGSNPFESSQSPPDSDGDGLTNKQEITWGSDPSSGDTDSDGLNDNVEFHLKTSPISQDTDSDGYDDRTEVGSDLNNIPDFDKDGIIDARDSHLSFNFRDPMDAYDIHYRFGITADAKGNIYIANYADDLIEAFDVHGNAIPGPAEENLSLPSDIASTGEALFLADTGNNRILRLELDGRLIETYERQPDGEAGGFVSPRGVDADSNGNILVADTWNDRIQKYDAQSGTWIAAGRAGTGEGEFLDVMDIAANGTGAIAVADYGNYRVQIFDSSLRLTMVIDCAALGMGPFEFKPKSLAYDPDGNLFVVDEAGSRIVVIDPDGNLTRSFGSDGEGIYEFRNPSGIHVDADGKIYVADQYRVQVF